MASPRPTARATARIGRPERAAGLGRQSVPPRLGWAGDAGGAAVPADAEPEVGGVRDVGQAEAFELDVGPAGLGEQADAVAEQDRGDENEDLVELAGVEALPGDVGADDVDVAVTS